LKKKPVGRPTLYREEYVEQAFKYCLLGADDVRLGQLFDVNPDTIAEWKKIHPEFSEALKRGKDEADAKVAASLYHRACGYSHDAVKIFSTMDGIQKVDYVEHYPPDTGAAFIWLKNRQGKNWRDKSEVESKQTLEAGDSLTGLLAALRGSSNAKQG
jgi:hypothetical protein